MKKNLHQDLLRAANPDWDNQDSCTISDREAKLYLDSFLNALNAKKKELDKVRSGEIHLHSIKSFFDIALPFFKNSLDNIAREFAVAPQTLASVATSKAKPNALEPRFYAALGQQLTIPFLEVKSAIEGGFLFFNKPISGISLPRFGNSTSSIIRSNALHELSMKARPKVPESQSAEIPTFISEIQKCWKSSE